MYLGQTVRDRYRNWLAGTELPRASIATPVGINDLRSYWRNLIEVRGQLRCQ